jgi:hypothetical protein
VPYRKGVSGDSQEYKTQPKSPKNSWSSWRNRYIDRQMGNDDKGLGAYVVKVWRKRRGLLFQDGRAAYRCSLADLTIGYVPVNPP